MSQPESSTSANGWFTTSPFSEPEVFPFPGDRTAVVRAVEHEEVVLMPLARRRTGDVQVRTRPGVHRCPTDPQLGLDGIDPIDVRYHRVARDVVAAVLPDPASLGKDMRGKTRRIVVGAARAEGEDRSIYLYHVVDNAWSMREFGHRPSSGRRQ